MTLEESLKKHPYSTAKQLAKLMGVSIPTVYRRVKMLQEGGVQVASGYVIPPKGKTGPKSATFALVKP